MLVFSLIYSSSRRNNTLYSEKIHFNCIWSLTMSCKWNLSITHCHHSLVFFFSTSTIGLTVSLGRETLFGSNPNLVSRSVSEIIKHPSYDESTNNNDMALLKLSSPVTFNDYIKPVCLMAAGSDLGSGTKTWITGWGTIGSDGETSLELFTKSFSLNTAQRTGFQNAIRCFKWISQSECSLRWR